MKKFTITATEAHGNVRWFNTTADRKLQKKAQKVLNKCYRGIRRASKRGKEFFNIQMVNCPWEKREWLETQLTKDGFTIQTINATTDTIRISWKVVENW